jgi:outer membrane protein
MTERTVDAPNASPYFGGVRTILMAGLLVAFGGSSLAHAEALVGYVDLQKAILTVDEGKRAKAQLEKTANEKQTLLTQREQRLKELKDKLDATMGSDDPDAQAQRAEFQQKLMELQQTFMKEQQELEQLQQKELSVITGKMRETIAEIGKKGGYTLILEIQENRLLFAQDHLDLTNEVIRRYNAKYK